jgi:hypothetical protein
MNFEVLTTPQPGGQETVNEDVSSRFATLVREAYLPLDQKRRKALYLSVSLAFPLAEDIR